MTHTIRTLAAIAATLSASLLAMSPADAVQGNPADWTYIGVTAENSPAFDPCTTITWSADGVPLTRGMTKAVRQAAKWSGLTFQQVPSGGMIHASFNDALATTGALAAANTEWEIRGGLMWTIGSSLEFQTLLFDPRHPFRLYANVMHELGHALGLGHAANTVEVMGGNSTARHYQSGDRAGLRAVQRTSCAPPMVDGSVARTTVR